jgi:hypothetical protein
MRLSANAMDNREPGAASAPMDDPVGVTEIARRIGVSGSDVDRWRVREADFPAPDRTVAGQPAWEWDAIERWAKTTGKLG